MRATRTSAAEEAASGGEAGKENLSGVVKLESTRPKRKGTQSKRVLEKIAEVESQSAPPQSIVRTKSLRSKPAPASKPAMRKPTKSVTGQDAMDGEPGEKDITLNETKSAKAMSTSKKVMQPKEQDPPTRLAATTGKKRKRTSAPKSEIDSDELPHGLGMPLQANEDEAASAIKGQEDMEGVVKAEEPTAELNVSPLRRPSTSTRARGRTADKTTPNSAPTADVKEEPPAKKPPKKKANPYGLTPG
ncbi:MAG: hypothetical protein LQ341_003741, partial [Variospora aurantia]